MNSIPEWENDRNYRNKMCIENDWKGIGPESNSPFDEIDLTEKEWSEYDEKIQVR